MSKEKEEYPVIRIRYLFFKRKCCFCGKRTRYKNFEILEMNRIMKRLFSSYCCTECCDSEKDVRKKVLKIYLRNLK